MNQEQMNNQQPIQQNIQPNMQYNNPPQYNQTQMQQSMGQMTPMTTPQKKGAKLPIIIIASVIVIATIAGITTLAVTNSGKKNELKDQKKEEEIVVNEKEIEYYNKDAKYSKDKIGFIINEDESVFVGITKENAAESFKGIFKNDSIAISNYERINKKVGIVSDVLLDMDYTTSEHVIENGKEYINHYSTSHDEVVFKESPFYMIPTSTQKYNLLYAYNEEKRYGEHNYLNMFDLGYFEQIEEAKETIEKYKKHTVVCIIDENKECTTMDGQKIDINEYRIVDDMAIDLLKEYGIYLNSYKEIDEINRKLIVFKVKTELSDETVRVITKIHPEETKEIDSEWKQFELNGLKAYLGNERDRKIYIITKDSYADLEISIPYGVEESEENYIKIAKEVFSKEK